MVPFSESEDETDNNKSPTVTATRNNSRGTMHSQQKKKRTGRPLKNLLSLLSPNNNHRKRTTSHETMDTAESHSASSSAGGGSGRGGGAKNHGKDAGADALPASGAFTVSATEDTPGRRPYVSVREKKIDDLPSEVDLVPNNEVSEFLAEEDSQWDNDDDDGCDNDSPLDQTEDDNKDYHFCCERAIRYATAGQYERSLRELNRGMRILTAATALHRDGGASGTDFHRKMVLFRASLLARLGRFSESLEDYRSVLEEVDGESEAGGDDDEGGGDGKSTVAHTSVPSTRPLAGRDIRSACDIADRANLLYACGRLCTHLRRYREAMEYHHRELELTKCLVLGASAAGGSTDADPATKNGAILSRIYHDLAVLCSRSCDPDGALSYYQQALDVETAVWERARQDAAALSQQGSGNPRLLPHEGGGECRRSRRRRRDSGTREEEEFEYEATAPTALSREVREAARQIRDTKQKMGRILFERGEVERAVEISILGHRPARGV